MTLLNIFNLNVILFCGEFSFKPQSKSILRNVNVHSQFQTMYGILIQFPAWNDSTKTSESPSGFCRFPFIKCLLFIVLVHLVASAHALVCQWLLVNAAVGVAKTHLDL